MATEKSLTGRTTASVTVSERGAVEVFVNRGGRVVHSFSIEGEPDLPKARGTSFGLSKDKKSVEVRVDGKVHELIPVAD